MHVDKQTDKQTDVITISLCSLLGVWGHQFRQMIVLVKIQLKKCTLMNFGDSFHLYVTHVHIIDIQIKYFVLRNQYQYTVCCALGLNTHMHTHI